MKHTAALLSLTWTFCNSAIAPPPSIATPKQGPQLLRSSSSWVPQQHVRVIKDLRNNSFVASILVGTPPREVTCKVETGSADVWLSAQVVEQSQTFIPQLLQESFAKTPVQDLGKVPKILSPGGTSRGYQGMETIRVGSQVFENQSVYVLADASLPEDRDWDGICGLGHRQIATKVPALYSRVAGASPGGLAVFALIPKSYGQAYTVADKVPLSAIKPGTLAWVDAEPVRSGGKEAFWVVPGIVAINRDFSMGGRFILDTGVPFILAPSSVYLSLVQSLLPAQMLDESCGVDVSSGNVVCDCTVIGLSDVTPLRMSLGEQEFLINFTDLFDQVQTQGNGEVCQLQIQQNYANSTDLSHSSTATYGSEEADRWVLGNTFLKRYCLFLDFEKNRVGFAEPAEKLSAAEVVTSREPSQEQVLGPSVTKGRKTELAADMQVLATQNDQLRRNITNLQNQLQDAKTFNALREAEVRKVILRLEDEQRGLRDKQSSLLQNLTEVREQEEEEEKGTSLAVLRRIQEENDQLRDSITLKQEELQHSADNVQLQVQHPEDNAQLQEQRHHPELATPWSGLHDEVKALSMQNGELLRTTVELRQRNQYYRNRQANFYLALLVSCVASSSALLLGTYSKLATHLGRFGELPNKIDQEATMDMTCSMLEQRAAEFVREGRH